jgi:hypothetical protein
VRLAHALLLALALLAGCAAPKPAATTAAAPKLPSYLRQDLYPQWIGAQGQIKWPPDAGFAGAPVANTVPKGALIDRFGGDTGTFFSPRGQSFAARALPYVCAQMAYTVYRLDQPLDVLSGTAAPWFGEPGGAVQYETKESAAQLTAAKKIEVVTVTPSGGVTPGPQCRAP